jgi:hypothetical protein
MPWRAQDDIPKISLDNLWDIKQVRNFRLINAKQRMSADPRTSIKQDVNFYSLDTAWQEKCSIRTSNHQGIWAFA